MKRFTLVGFFALLCLASFAHAAGICSTDYSAVTTFVPAGATGSGGANGASALNNLNTSYCGSDAPNSLDPTAARVNFLANAGAYLDTINWSSFPADCTPYYCAGDGDPISGNSQTGASGVNGTGYSWGTADEAVVQTNSLGTATQTGTLPNFAPNQNILTGLIGGVGNMALTWDTGTTGATYITDPSTPGYPQCNNSGYDPSCWQPGLNTGAIISGLGFDLQLENGQGGGSVGPWGVTFAVYGYTPGCSTGSMTLGQSTIEYGGAQATFDCFDYQYNQMTDGFGNDVPNGCNPTNFPPNGFYASDPNCSNYTDNTIQLLGYVTINSDSNGDPAFFGLTTTDPLGIGALVMTGDTFGNGDNPTVNFSIDEVTLMTTPQPVTPEPATLLLFGSGLLIAARRLRKNAVK